MSVLWRRKGLVILSVLSCVTLGLIYLAQATPIFESEARVLIQQQDLLNAASRIRTDAEFLSTQAEIIRSPVIIEKALKTVTVPVPEGSTLDPVLF
ncbi:MAG: Wzz/FepE/Etk N-terminal domain-containing protein, partial [Planctomycetaceae bacterium]